MTQENTTLMQYLLEPDKYGNVLANEIIPFSEFMTKLPNYQKYVSYIDEHKTAPLCENPAGLITLPEFFKTTSVGPFPNDVVATVNNLDEVLQNLGNCVIQDTAIDNTFNYDGKIESDLDLTMLSLSSDNFDRQYDVLLLKACRSLDVRGAYTDTVMLLFNHSKNFYYIYQYLNRDFNVMKIEFDYQDSRYKLETITNAMYGAYQCTLTKIKNGAKKNILDHALGETHELYIQDIEDSDGIADEIKLHLDLDNTPTNLYIKPYRAILA